MAIDGGAFGFGGSARSGAKRVHVEILMTPAKREAIKQLAAHHGVSVGQMLDEYVRKVHGSSHVLDEKDPGIREVA